VLVAFEDVYRVYRDTIAAGIRLLRPEFEVMSTNLDELEREIARLDPQVVVCSQDEPASKYPELTWVKAPIETDPHSEVLTLEKLLAIIDESQETRALGAPTRTRAADDVRPLRKRS
jgi:hypothetical protein